MNIDESKVKDLLRGIVNDIFDCLPDNQYTQSEKKSAMSRIKEANLAEDLLTERPACATVKHQNEGGHPYGGYGYEPSNGKTT